MEFILEIGQDKDGKGALKWVGRGDKMIIDMSRELFCILFFVISVIGYIFYKKRNATIQYWIIPVFVIYLLYLSLYFFNKRYGITGMHPICQTE